MRQLDTSRESEATMTIDCTTGVLRDVFARLVKTYGAARLVQALRLVITDPVTRQHLARILTTSEPTNNPHHRERDETMPKLKITQYTLVQHSGFRHDVGFAQAVEEAVVTTEAELQTVRKAGGALYSTYREVSKAEYDENYPPNVKGIYPKAKGTFSTQALDGRKIYVLAGTSAATIPAGEEPTTAKAK
jgi:hypothetical protein